MVPSQPASSSDLTLAAPIVAKEKPVEGEMWAVDAVLIAVVDELMPALRELMELFPTYVAGTDLFARVPEDATPQQATAQQAKGLSRRRSRRRLRSSPGWC